MNYYISDLHFMHTNIISFDGRPYQNIKEMNAQLIKNWNSVVKNNDIVYILGDFCWSTKEEDWLYVLRRLNGQKFLIKGNHDKKIPAKAKKMFCQICDYKEVYDAGRKVILSHHAMLFYPSDYRDNTYMLFGHVHNNKEWELMEKIIDEIKATSNNFWGSAPRNKANLYNVGCMMPWMNFTPRTLDQIISGYDKYRSGNNIQK